MFAVSFGTKWKRTIQLCCEFAGTGVNIQVSDHLWTVHCCKFEEVNFTCGWIWLDSGCFILMGKQKHNLNREGRVRTSSGVTLSGTVSIFKWKNLKMEASSGITSTNTYENVHSARASRLPCGLLIDETLLQCVGETLVNQGVADEGSSLAQRGFQLTTFINIHTGQNPIWWLF